MYVYLNAKYWRRCITNIFLHYILININKFYNDLKTATVYYVLAVEENS